MISVYTSQDSAHLDIVPFTHLREWYDVKVTGSTEREVVAVHRSHVRHKVAANPWHHFACWSSHTGAALLMQHKHLLNLAYFPYWLNSSDSSTNSSPTHQALRSISSVPFFICRHATHCVVVGLFPAIVVASCQEPYSNIFNVSKILCTASFVHPWVQPSTQQFTPSVSSCSLTSISAITDTTSRFPLAQNCSMTSRFSSSLSFLFVACAVDDFSRLPLNVLQMLRLSCSLLVTSCAVPG